MTFTGDMETCHVGHDVTVDIWSNRIEMGLWTKSLRMSRSESHNFSRLHERRIKFRYGYLVTDQNTSGIALGTVFAFKVSYLICIISVIL